jgi:fructose-1,6-bisphosphatase/inositol monophosphatase family enzyme
LALFGTFEQVFPSTLGAVHRGRPVRTIEDLAAIARDAVKLAAELVKTATPHQVIEKGDRDTVTVVDIKVEQEVRAYLRRLTPECGFLGEEEGHTGSDEYTWTLDPIDGTSTSCTALPLCAVSLALVHRRAGPSSPRSPRHSWTSTTRRSLGEVIYFLIHSGSLISVPVIAANNASSAPVR